MSRASSSRAARKNGPRRSRVRASSRPPKRAPVRLARSRVFRRSSAVSALTASPRRAGRNSPAGARGRPLGPGRRHRPGGGGRGFQRPEAVEGEARGEHRRGGAGRGVGRRRGGAGERHDAAQHGHEQARQRQVRPGGVGGDVDQDHHALPALGGGDDRGAVLQGGPGAPGEFAVRLGEDLAPHADIGRRRQAGERALGGEGRERARAVPGQGAAEVAPAPAQAHRHEIVAAGGEPRPGEAQEQAALVDEGRDPFQGRGVEGADIGEHQHRDLGIEHLADRFRDAAPAAGLQHVGEGGERPREVIGRREERLGLVAGPAEDEADPAAASALVGQHHGAGRVLAGDLEPRDGVAQLHRQVEADRRRVGSAREREVGLGERQALGVEGPHRAGIAPVGGGPHHAHAELPTRRIGSGQRQRRRPLGLEHGDLGAVAPGQYREALRKGVAVRPRHAVVDPHDGAARRLVEEGGECGEMRGAVGEVRQRLDRPQTLQSRAGAGGFEARRRRSRGQERHRPPGAGRRLDLGGGDADAVAPVLGGGKSVVEDENEGRTPVARGLRGRVPDRARHRQDQAGGGEQPERQQPGRGTGRRLALGQQVGEDAQRREVDPPRPRRRHPQQVPERRERDQRREGGGGGEAEGQSEHRRRPQPAPRAAATRVTRRNAASLAGRSVRCRVRVQPCARAISPKASRWARIRRR